jgi:hypothetical protein
MEGWRWSVTTCMLVIFAITYSPATGEDIGQIKTLTGEVYIVRQSVKRPAQAGDRLEPTDGIITGPDGSVGITFIDNSRFSAGPHSHIERKVLVRWTRDAPTRVSPSRHRRWRPPAGRPRA